MSAGKVLVIDDEPQLRRLIRTTLIGAGYEVDDAKSGEDGLEKIGSFHPDLVLLDMNMPGMGGLAACKLIRADKSVAIIMLTVRDSEEDKILALDAGADDYVTKPFSTPELLARIRAALRRVPALQPNVERVRLGHTIVDFSARTVEKEGESFHLTPKELELLRYLTQHPNQILSHRELLQAVWGADYGYQVEYLRAFVKNLRKKIEINPEHPEMLITEPWAGYRFNTSPEYL